MNTLFTYLLFKNKNLYVWDTFLLTWTLKLKNLSSIGTKGWEPLILSTILPRLGTICPCRWSSVEWWTSRWVSLCTSSCRCRWLAIPEPGECFKQTKCHLNKLKMMIISFFNYLAMGFAVSVILLFLSIQHEFLMKYEASFYTKCKPLKYAMLSWIQIQRRSQKLQE